MGKRTWVKRKVKTKARKVKQEVKDFTQDRDKLIFSTILVGGVTLAYIISDWLGITLK